MDRCRRKGARLGEQVAGVGTGAAYRVGGQVVGAVIGLPLGEAQHYIVLAQPAAEQALGDLEGSCGQVDHSPSVPGRHRPR